jgi:hypothetical protein
VVKTPPRHPDWCSDPGVLPPQSSAELDSSPHGDTEQMPSSPGLGIVGHGFRAMGEAAERVGLPSYGAQADAAVSAGAPAAETVDVLVGWFASSARDWA